MYLKIIAVHGIAAQCCLRVTQFRLISLTKISTVLSAGELKVHAADRPEKNDKQTQFTEHYCS